MSILFSFLGSAVVVVLLYFLYWLSSRRCSRERAYAECWWLPGWNCFRFVIRNMHSEDDLSSVKYRAWLRSIESATQNCSVNTFVDNDIVSGERILLPRGQDLPILCFRFEQHGNMMKLIHTNKLGKPINVYDLGPSVDSLKVEYYLKLRSWFLFKHEIVRIFEIPHYLTTVEGKEEDIFDLHFFKKQQQDEHRIQTTFKTAEVITVAV